MDFDSMPEDKAQSQAPAASPVPKFDDLPDSSGLQFDDIPGSVSKYESTGQQALTGLEGFGRGISGGLSDVLAKGMRSAATSLGVSPENLHYIAPDQENIAGRQEANPIEAGGSELAGNIALFNALPQAGSKAIDGMIKMGALSGTDELSKAMLGTGDPTPAVAAHIAGSGALGLLTGGLFGKAEQLGAKGLSRLEDAKIGNRFSSFLTGVGHAAQFPIESGLPSEEGALKQMASLPEDLHAPSFKAGQDFYNSMVGKASAKALRTIADLASFRTGSISDLAAAHFGGIAAEKVFNKVIPRVGKSVIGPAFIKAASHGSSEALSQAMDHATSCAQGAQKISRGLESLFDGTANKAVEITTNEKEREKLKEFIEGGGVDKQVQDEAQSTQPVAAYAEGGEVAPVPPLTQSNKIASLWPEQNIMLNTAKGRVSRYLNSIRPIPNPNKLPYDTEHEHPQKKHEYNQILDLANQPLSILNKIKDGSLSVAHAGAFKSMHPELHQTLSQKIREKIIRKHIDEEKKPSYPMRQSMSLFLGQNLESTLTPQNIQAAQNSFVAQKAQQAQGNAPPNSKAELSKIGQSAQTQDQARAARQQTKT